MMIHTNNFDSRLVQELEQRNEFNKCACVGDWIEDGAGYTLEFLTGGKNGGDLIKDADAHRGADCA